MNQQQRNAGFWLVFVLISLVLVAMALPIPAHRPDYRSAGDRPARGDECPIMGKKKDGSYYRGVECATTP
jgi:hypothetical protein